MTLILIIGLAALGLLTASNAVMEKLPSAEKVISFLRPFEEIIGIASFAFGLFKLVFWVLGLAILFTSPLSSLFLLVSFLTLIGLGAYLGRASLKKTLPFAAGWIDRIVEIVTARRRTIGLVALALAIIHLVLWIS
jgi:hypothetical protein